MIGVNAHLVISAFTFDIKLFVAINGGFISFVSNGAYSELKLRV